MAPPLILITLYVTIYGTSPSLTIGAMPTVCGGAATAAIRCSGLVNLGAVDTTFTLVDSTQTFYWASRRY